MTDFSPREIVSEPGRDIVMAAFGLARRSLDIAADICVYTNRNVTVETLQT
jgi:ATP-dependent protease HslVU (ClpYQ) peptidase subunit